MDLAFCWCFPTEPPEAGLCRLREYGFDGIELWPQHLQQYPIERWAEALARADLACCQICPYFDFVHGPEKLRASHRIFDAYLSFARRLSCRRIRVFTGPPWGEGIVGVRDANPRQWADATAALRAYCTTAARDGVELCLECHEGSLMENSASALKLINAVGCSNLTVNLQLPLVGEDWPSSVAALGSRTTHIHIHNWMHNLGQGELTFLDAGAFDWRPVLSSLAKFESATALCLSVEHGDHGQRHDPWETARRDGAYLQKLRNHWRSQPQ